MAFFFMFSLAAAFEYDSVIRTTSCARPRAICSCTGVVRFGPVPVTVTTTTLGLSAACAGLIRQSERRPTVVDSRIRARFNMDDSDGDVFTISKLYDLGWLGS